MPSWLPDILGRRSALAVRLASDGDLLRPGVVLVGPADRHLVLLGDGTVWLSPEAPVQFLRPSADRLFESLARVCGPDAIAVVLSGAGSDGAAGTRVVKSAGGTVIAEDATTAQFFGMPGAAAEVADLVPPIQEIAEALVSLTLERER
jgi:two-component system, chemotaxis family, protein-glutamate methylesterase/glutaminase